MRDSRAIPGFGQVDLDIGDDPNGTLRPPAAFGQVDLELPPSSDEEPGPPPSTSRVMNADRNARPTIRKPQPSVHDESTRIVQGDALAAITRPPPRSPLGDDGNTRAWAEVDDALLAMDEDNAPSAPSGGSGVATRDNRVAAMRELYARGDADGALAVAATLGHSVAPDAGADSPDASIVVEFGEQSIDLADPFGGLIVEDDDLAARVTAPPIAPGLSMHPTSPPMALPQLTLTERHSIPRLLKSMAEVSKLKIDHRAGFLLAHVDGMQTLEEILDICAMPPAAALELITNLKAMGVIEFE